MRVIDYITVYALVDPRDGRIRYIGVTVRTLKNRLRSHVSAREKNRKGYWVTHLKSLGLRPTIAELERVPLADGPAAESRWVTRLNEAGFDLLNYVSAIGRLGRTGPRPQKAPPIEERKAFTRNMRACLVASGKFGKAQWAGKSEEEKQAHRDLMREVNNANWKERRKNPDALKLTSKRRATTLAQTPPEVKAQRQQEALVRGPSIAAKRVKTLAAKSPTEKAEFSERMATIHQTRWNGRTDAEREVIRLKIVATKKRKRELATA